MAVGLYLHYPNLNSDERQAASVGEGLSSPSADTFFRALQTETKLIAEAGGNHNRRVNSIYVDGATPSRDHTDQLRLWMNQASELFVWNEPLELTISVAPNYCSRHLLEKYLILGVTRFDFSIGSFERRSLRLLGRKQTTHQVHEAIYLTNALGFGSFGCDFVFGLPGQTGKLLSADLDRITDLDPPHISLQRWGYNPELTVEPPDFEFVDTLRRAAVEHLFELGYEEYVTDRFARPDHECRYYADRASGGDYLGLGPSARSLVDGQRSSNVPDLPSYLAALEQGRRPIVND